jgi:hypothetical protein
LEPHNHRFGNQNLDVGIDMDPFLYFDRYPDQNRVLDLHKDPDSS